MTNRRRWFDREFELGLPLKALPDVLERIRGTPVRLEERTGQLDPETLTCRLGDEWSIQENVGHLVDLEPLWSGRVDDLVSGASDLRPADLENRKTHEAQHNLRGQAELLAEFRELRHALVSRVETLSDDETRRTAQHPRLNQPMTVVDLLFFVAEHDDHHLAQISRLMREAG